MELAKEQQAKPLSFLKKAFIAIAILGVVLLAAALSTLYYYKKEISPVATTATKVEVSIPNGSNTAKISEILYDKGLIRNKTIFRLYARWHKYDGQLKAGEYQLAKNQTAIEILEKLKSGSKLTYSYTIPEGYTVRQITDVLAAKKLVNRDRFMYLVANGKFNYDFLAGAPPGERRLEGFLFPDTYYIEPHTKEEDIINMMLDRFNKELTPEVRAQAQAMNMSIRQIVILASVIEREAKVPQDRPLVSAVFYNRLKIGMKLESCATVQYVLGDPNKKILSLKDIAIDSPYNTYKYPGLPIGPIASPGKASLQAALNPAKVRYLYFVAKPDGSNAFSNTEAEHETAKKKYLGK